MKYFALFILVSISFLGFTAEAQETLVRVSKKVGSKEIPLDWKGTGTWIWVRPYEFNLVASPVLRVSVTFPFHASFRHLDSRIVQIASIPSKRTQELILDIPFYMTDTSLRVDHGNSTTWIKMTWENATPLLVHKSCTEAGIDIARFSQTTKRHEPNLAITCNWQGSKIAVNILHELGYIYHESHANFENDIGRFRTLVYIPRQNVNQPKDADISKFGIKEFSTQRVIEYMISSNGEQYRSTTFSFGTSLTYASYSEPSAGISLDQVLLTGKFSLLYQIKPKSWELNVNAFSSLVSFFSSEEDQLLATYYGANFRVGKNILTALSKYSLTPSLGWYFWGMNTNSSGWGINYLTGPQVFLSFTLANVFSTYVKYAFIFEKPSNLKLSNSELALGLQIPVCAFANGDHLSLSGDASLTRFESQESAKSMRLSTFSLGLTYSF